MCPIPKKPSNFDITNYVPHCVLTPRCHSCKKVRNKFVKFILKRNGIPRRCYLLKNSNIKRLLNLENFNKKKIIPFNCCKCPPSIDSNYSIYSCAKTQHLPQAIHPPSNLINNNILYQNNKSSCIPFLCSECYTSFASITNTKLKSRLIIDNKKKKSIKPIKGFHFKKEHPFTKCCKIHNFANLAQSNNKQCTCIYMQKKEKQCNCNILVNQKSHEISKENSPRTLINGCTENYFSKSKICKHEEIPNSRIDLRYLWKNPLLQQPLHLSKKIHKDDEVSNFHLYCNTLNCPKISNICIDKKTTTPKCNLFLPCRDCHCHKIQGNFTSCSKNTFCRFCSCHQISQSHKVIPNGPKLRKLCKPFRKPLKLYYSSQVFEKHSKTSILKYKQKKYLSSKLYFNKKEKKIFKSNYLNLRKSKFKHYV